MSWSFSRVKFEELFGADLRSLAALRIGIALIILIDLITRSSDLASHYTDFGVLPRSTLLERLASRWIFSLHLLSGVWQMQAALFLLAGIFGVALLLGYKTRLATAVSWFLLISLHGRNPMVLQGGDVLLRVVLFWAMFLPWGARYSLDSVMNPSWEKLPKHVLSGGTIAYAIQIVIVYWFSVLHKSGPEWRSEGTAVYFALNVDQFVTPFGQFLLHSPAVFLKFLTHGVLWFELFGPLLLFSPIFTGLFRTAVVFGFVVMQLGFGMSLSLGNFPWVSAFSMLFFLPSGFWEKILGAHKPDERPGLKIYYDQDCGFCAKSVQIIRTFLLPEGKLLPAQSDLSVQADMEKYKSWVVVDSNGGRHFGFQGFVRIARLSPFLWPLLPLLRLSWVSDVGEKAYASIATHRRTDCAVHMQQSTAPVPGLKLSVLSNTLAICLLGYVLYWNLTGLPGSKFALSERFRSVGYLLRLDQEWNLFAPYPLKHDGWYIIPGKLRNGEEIDLFNKTDFVDWDKPLSVGKTFKNSRWRKYMMNLWYKVHHTHRLFYAQYLCRQWNASHNANEALEELEVIFVLEQTLPNYRSPKPQRMSFLKYNCNHREPQTTEFVAGGG